MKTSSKYEWIFGLKNEKFVCPFGLKIGRVGRLIFFFFFLNLDAEEMQYHSCVCALLGIQSLRIGLTLVLLEGGCIPLNLFKEPFLSQ